MSVDLSSPPTTRHRLSVPTLLFFLVLVVAGAAGGAYAGLRYLGTSVTAESRLVVGDQSVRAQSVPGYALATQQLASTYSRLIGSAAADDSITASPIPDSAIIRVRATAPDDAAAIAAANEAAVNLIETANKARGQEEDDALAQAYLRAQTELQTAQTRATAAATGPAAAAGEAAGQAALAQVRVDAAAESVRDNLRASLSNSAGVTVVSEAVVTDTAAPRATLLGAFAGGAGVALLLAAGVVLARARR